jgi:ribosome-associated protein
VCPAEFKKSWKLPKIANDLYHDVMDFNMIATEVIFTAVRSRGPGGQNVNKVSSAALLKWAYGDSSGLSPEEKLRVQAQAQGWINKRNEIAIRCDEYRDLARNKAKCLEKLESLLLKALHRPKTRRPTKPTKASQLRNREAKQIRSKIKKLRQSAKRI